MTRSALLLLLAAVSCAPETTETCPGEPVARFAFEAEVATTPLSAGLDPDVSLTDCAAAAGFPIGTDTAPALRFTATVSHGPAPAAGALCRANGQILYGTRDGATWTVRTASNGAVLGGCAKNCAARSVTVITGVVLPDADAPTSFEGGLVEQLWATDDGADCGSCALPCAMRYVLAGTPEVPQP